MPFNSLSSSRWVFLAGCAAVLVAIGVGLGAFPNRAEAPKNPPPAVPAAPPAVAEKAPDTRRDVFGDPLPPGALARLGTTRFREYSRTRDFALSPDGKTIAVGDENFSLLDAVTGQVLRHQTSVRVGCDYTFPAQEGHFTTPGIFWRPDGHGVALVGRHPWSKYLWDFTDPKDVPPTFDPKSKDPLPPAPPEGAVSCAAVSADGKWIAIARQPSDPNRRVVQVFPCQTGKYLSDLKGERTLGPFSSACERIWFTANGRELILARADRTVIAVDASTGKELRRATLPKWAVIAASPDGKFVAVVPRHAERDVWHTGDETVRVWDLTTGKEVWKLPRPGDSITGLAFTPDGQHLITSDQEFDFRKWDLASGKEAALRQPRAGRESMSVVAVSADGKRYATARAEGEIKVWDAGTGTHLNALVTHRDAAGGAAVSPDSRLVATLGYDGTVRVWEATTGKQVWTAKAPRRNPMSAFYGARRPVAFTPDGRGVVFDAAGVLTMADATTGKPRDLPGGLKGHTGFFSGFSADGHTLVTFYGETTTLWDWPAGTPRNTFRVPLEKQSLWGPPMTPLVVATVGAALSPDGGTLFTISNQQHGTEYGVDGPNSTICWDVKTGKRRFRFAPDLWYPHLALSPDGKALYAGGTPSDPEGKHDRLRRDGLASWDAETGTIVRRFDDPGKADGQIQAQFPRHVQALAPSPDGRLLAVYEAFPSQGIWVHETASGRVVRHLDGHRGDISDLVFTPDGSKLISASDDCTALVWDVTLPTFTDRKAGPLTPKELADSWDRLAAPDPVLAWRAVADFAGSPTEAVAFLAEHLKSPPVPTAADLDRIEKQFEAPGFADREKASAELDAFGPNAVAPVRARLRTTESPEVAQRFGAFLKRHAGEPASPLVLREARGVLVLEAIGTPDARKILVRLAGSRPGDQLGVEAAAALARLKKARRPEVILQDWDVTGRTRHETWARPGWKTKDKRLIGHKKRTKGTKRRQKAEIRRQNSKMSRDWTLASCSVF